jgi:Fe-S-cluster containining protein
MPINLCQRCGACCAIFKVLFPSIETDMHPGGKVPVNHTIEIGPTRSAMRGTETSPRRCMALQGIVGESVTCTIYAKRPSACQLFLAAWENVGGNAQCDRARGCYGLTPFSEY